MAEDLGTRIAVLEERLRGMRVALDLQASEYLRRLDELNHAYANAQKEREKAVTVDKFDGFVTEMRSWQGQTQTTLDELKGKTMGTGSAKASAFQIVTLLVALAGLVTSVAMALWGGV